MPEIHFNPQRGELTLECQGEEFAKLLDTIVAEAGAAEIIGDQGDKIHRIFIDTGCDAPAQSWWRDRVALVGCAVVACSILFVFFAGVVMIVGWIR